MRRSTKIAAIAFSASVVAGSGVIYTEAAGSTRTAPDRPVIAAAPAVGDVYTARRNAQLATTDVEVVALSLPAGSYTVHVTVSAVYADLIICHFPGTVAFLQDRHAGYSEASLSGTSALTLSATTRVAVKCKSATILPEPQSAGTNTTIVATKVGVINDQGTGV